MTTRGASKDLKFRFVGDASKLQAASKKAQRALGDVESRSQRLGRNLQSFGRTMTLKVGLPIAAAFALGARSLIENERLLAQTQAAIRSTGGAAGVTADQVLDLALNLSNLSGMAHENVVEGANMLLTFTNIRNEVGEGNDIFDQATLALADMSTALGTDMPQSAIQLGKALNDPILGVTALGRAGIQFTLDQKDQIRVMQEAGDVMGAQKIILKELQIQFGGSAEAAGETMAGALNKMKNSAEEVARGLAIILIPALEAVTGALQTVFDWFNRQGEATQTAISGFLLLAAAIGPAGWITGKLIAGFGAIKSAYETMYLFILTHPLLGTFAALAAAITVVTLGLTSDFSPAVAAAEKALDAAGVAAEDAAALVAEYGTDAAVLAAKATELMNEQAEAAPPLFDLLADKIGVTVDVLHRLKPAVADTGREFRESSADTAIWTQIQADAAEAADEARRRIDEQRQAVIDLTAAEREAVDPALNLLAARQRFADASAKYQAVLADNEASERDVLEAQADQLRAWGDLEAARGDFAVNIGESLETVRLFGDAMGWSADETERFNRAIQGTPGISAVPGKVSVGGIEAFQSGGVVPGAPSQARLAVVHGGETITPAGHGGAPTTVNVYFGTEKLTDAIIRVEEHNRRRGRR